MTYRKRRLSLVSQQRRLLSDLDALSKTVAELEAGMGSRLAKAGRRRRNGGAPLAALAGLRERFKARLGRKQRQSWRSDSDAVESNDR